MRLSPQTGRFLGVDPGPPTRAPHGSAAWYLVQAQPRAFQHAHSSQCSAAVKGQVLGFPSLSDGRTWGASPALMVGPVLGPGPWARSIQAVLAREAISGCRWLWAAPSNATHANPSLVPSEAHILPASKGPAELQLGKPGPIRVNPAPSWPSLRPCSPLSGSAKGQAAPTPVSVAPPSPPPSFSSTWSPGVHLPTEQTHDRIRDDPWPAHPGIPHHVKRPHPEALGRNLVLPDTLSSVYPVDNGSRGLWATTPQASSPVQGTRVVS